MSDGVDFGAMAKDEETARLERQAEAWKSLESAAGRGFKDTLDQMAKRRGGFTVAEEAAADRVDQAKTDVSKILRTWPA